MDINFRLLNVTSCPLFFHSLHWMGLNLIVTESPIQWREKEEIPGPSLPVTRLRRVIPAFLAVSVGRLQPNEEFIANSCQKLDDRQVRWVQV